MVSLHLLLVVVAVICVSGRSTRTGVSIESQDINSKKIGEKLIAAIGTKKSSKKRQSGHDDDCTDGCGIDADIVYGVPKMDDVLSSFPDGPSSTSNNDLSDDGSSEAEDPRNILKDFNEGLESFRERVGLNNNIEDAATDIVRPIIRHLKELHQEREETLHQRDEEIVNTVEDQSIALVSNALIKNLGVESALSEAEGIASDLESTNGDTASPENLDVSA